MRRLLFPLLFTASALAALPPAQVLEIKGTRLQYWRGSTTPHDCSREQPLQFNDELETGPETLAVLALPNRDLVFMSKATRVVLLPNGAVRLQKGALKLSGSAPCRIDSEKITVQGSGNYTVDLDLLQVCLENGRAQVGTTVLRPGEAVSLASGTPQPVTPAPLPPFASAPQTPGYVNAALLADYEREPNSSSALPVNSGPVGGILGVGAGHKAASDYPHGLDPNRQTGGPAFPVFRWQPVAGADACVVILAADEGFKQLEWYSRASGTSASYPSSFPPLSRTRHYWRVVPVDSQNRPLAGFRGSQESFLVR